MIVIRNPLEAHDDHQKSMMITRNCTVAQLQNYHYGLLGGGVKSSLHHRARSRSSAVESLRIFSVLIFNCTEIICEKSKTIFQPLLGRGIFQIEESLKEFTVLTFT